MLAWLLRKFGVWFEYSDGLKPAGGRLFALEDSLLSCLEFIEPIDE